MKIKTLCVGPIGTNCYILEDDKTNKAAVIDPGDEADKIAQVLQKDGAEVEFLLTHGHYDHTGAVAELRQLWPEVPVYLNRRDRYDGDPYMAQLFPPVPEAADYDEGVTLSVGGLTVEVLATPGHSEGSVTLRCGEVLFCGDTLFAGSCGRTDFAGGDWREMLRSLGRLGNLPGSYQVYPGHDQPTTLDYERRANPYVRQGMK